MRRGTDKRPLMLAFLAEKLRRALTLFGLLAAATVSWPINAAAAPLALPAFNVDLHQTSVSGLSSGGFMAVQFDVAYSSLLKGAGIVAGGPYYCARGDVTIATTVCSCTGLPFFSVCQVGAGATKVNELVGITNQNARDGSIDPTSNLRNHKIWMLSGTADSVVPQPVMNDLHAYYRHYVDSANIQYKKNLHAQHAMPTDFFGNDCATLGSPYINNCHFDAAGELLKWIYDGNVNPRNTGTLSGRLIEFDQREFIADHKPTEHGMADSGFLYVPASCDKNGNQLCKLHVAFHGCRQDRGTIQQTYVKNAGYNKWADTNNMIILYPQTASSFNNPNACWNWFDFDHDDPGYAKKNGRQMAAVKAMIDRIAAVAPASGPMPAAACVTATNAEHVLAGRAHPWAFFMARANGSNAYMGWNNNFGSTTLRQTGQNFFVVGACS
jgi:poly(3-hydroxybutyrate) depolymerase